MKIALTSIFVADIPTAFTFYTEILGFVKRMYVPRAQLAIVVSPEDPEGTGLLLEPNESGIARSYQMTLYQKGLPVIVFGVRDVSKEYERLKGLGVVFRGEPETSEWGTQALFEDTCGNLILLQQSKS